MSRASGAARLAVLLASASASARSEDVADKQLDQVQQALLQPFKGDWGAIQDYVAYQRVAQAEQERAAARQTVESPKP